MRRLQGSIGRVCAKAFVHTDHLSDNGLLKAFNPTATSFTIDVHRHRVNEAMRLTKRAIRDALEKNASQLRVNVGPARAGRIHTLKLAMISELQK